MKIADKAYFTNADKSELVEEGSEEAAYLVVGKGSQVTPEMEKKYGIKGVEQEEAKAEPGIVTSGDEKGEQGFVSAKDAQKAGIVVSGEPAEEAEDEDEAPALKGRLPEDFPGRDALEAEGIMTYAQARKVKDMTGVPGIGKATAGKIAEALGESDNE